MRRPVRVRPVHRPRWARARWVPAVAVVRNGHDVEAGLPPPQSSHRPSSSSVYLELLERHARVQVVIRDVRTRVGVLVRVEELAGLRRVLDDGLVVHRPAAGAGRARRGRARAAAARSPGSFRPPRERRLPRVAFPRGRRRKRGDRPGVRLLTSVRLLTRRHPFRDLATKRSDLSLPFPERELELVRFSRPPRRDERVRLRPSHGVVRPCQLQTQRVHLRAVHLHRLAHLVLGAREIPGRLGALHGGGLARSRHLQVNRKRPDLIPERFVDVPQTRRFVLGAPRVDHLGGDRVFEPRSVRAAVVGGVRYPRRREPFELREFRL